MDDGWKRPKMLDNQMLLASVGCLAGAFVCLFAYHFSIYRELRQSRRETSRFPMFAARDRIVALVLDGEISEDDPSWRRLYCNVNVLLNLRHNLHILDYAWNRLRRLAQIAGDENLKKFYADARKHQMETAARVPGFRDALTAADNAFEHIVQRRSNVWHLTCVWMMLVIARGLLTALNAGVNVAASFFKSAKHLAVLGDPNCSPLIDPGSTARLARM